MKTTKRTLSLLLSLLVCTVIFADTELSITNVKLFNNNCWSRSKADVDLYMIIKTDNEFTGRFTIKISCNYQGEEIYCQDETADFCITYPGQDINFSHSFQIPKEMSDDVLKAHKWTLSFYYNGTEIPVSCSVPQITYCSESTLSLKVSSAQYSTVVLPYDLDFFPTGLTFYDITGIDANGELTLEKHTSHIYANTPLLVSGPEGTYTTYRDPDREFEITVPDVPTENIPTSLCTNGLLHGYAKLPDNNQKWPLNSYILEKHDDDVAFYQVKSDDLPMAAGKCYLELPSDSESPVRLTIPETPPTSIEAVSSPSRQIQSIHALDGTPRPSMTKGINIVRYSDGTVKKVIR